MFQRKSLLTQTIRGLLCLSLLFQNGCASIISRSEQDVQIRSNPAEASVEIDGMRYGSTPVMAKLKRKSRHEVKVSKEGFHPETRLTGRGFNWWFMGNIILGGIIGIIIDFATGAVYSVKPDEINISLEANPKAAQETKTTVNTTATAAKESISQVSANIASLEKLTELKEKGYITDAEFQTKKKELLET